MVVEGQKWNIEPRRRLIELAIEEATSLSDMMDRIVLTTEEDRRLRDNGE